MSDRFESNRYFNRTRTSFETSLLDLSNLRPESHVAQQSRRDKLRVLQHSNSSHTGTDFPTHLVQLSRESGINPDLIQVRNVRSCDLMYDPAMCSSLGMLNYSTNSHGLLTHRDAMLQQDASVDRTGRPVGTEDAPFVSDTDNPGYWKGFGSHQNCDWIVNFLNGSATNGCNQIPYSKHASIGYEDLRSPLTNPSNEISDQESIKQYGEMQFSTPFYQNALQEVVTSSSIGRQGFEVASVSQQRVRETGSWVDGGNELVLFPSYGNQSNGSRVNNAALLMHTPVDGNHQLKSELDFVANSNGEGRGMAASDSTPQGLSLSLSSHRPSDMLAVQFGGRFGSEDFQSQTNGLSSSQDSKTSGYLYSSSKSPLTRSYGNPIPGIASSSTYVRRSTAPLGPFTGYAMILKCSKFLKPAQQLLDELCIVTGPSFMGLCKTTDKGSRTIISSCNAANTETEIGTRTGRSGIPSFSVYSSNEASGECGSGPYQSCRPEFQQRKARLLYMQEEVCRRYKQYHHQMHFVVSSFESVAGLSAATPYTSLALKSVSRHFRGLKNVISDQLRHINKAIGEDLSSVTTGTSSSKGETISPKLRFSDHVICKQKSGGNSPGIVESQPRIWRPQRGLPERSVTILRAWLFEHFLHPYPTDTDKDMLASQAGLTRNQVSNWFINARVRVWKPMVEEIHMLEMKGSVDTNLNSSSNCGEPATNGSSEPMGDHKLNKFTVDAVSEKGTECSGVVALPNGEDDQSSEQCNRGKRTRMECEFPADVCGGLMGFMPYHQNRLDIGGVGAVSLTLGLRHSAENAQQLLHGQETQQEHELISHFGAPMVHDFVG